MPVTMFAVQSSSILSIGYDEEAQGLHIMFNGGHEYVYRDVPAELWEQFREANSIGKFFSREIRGIYPTKKVEKDND